MEPTGTELLRMAIAIKPSREASMKLN